MCTVRDHILLGIKHEFQSRDVKGQGTEAKKGQATEHTSGRNNILHMPTVEFCRSIWSVDKAQEKEKYLPHSTLVTS